MKRVFLFGVILAVYSASIFFGAAQTSGGAGGVLSGGAPSGGAVSGGGELPHLPPLGDPDGSAVSGGVVVPQPPTEPIIDPVTTTPDLPTVPPDVYAFEDVDCSDFETSHDANMFFQGYMSVLKLDVHRLDRKPYDGVVCTSLP